MTGSSMQSWAASLAVALVGAAWGIYWLPLRALQALGFTGEWATAALFVASLPAVLPLVFIARDEVKSHGRSLIGLALANGAAFTLYSNAYAHTSVFNVLFLFYLSPVWSVLLGRLWLGERAGMARMACVLLGFSGLVVMLSADGGWPVPRNAGDWMALASGMVWAISAIKIRRNQHIGAAANAVAFFLGGLVPALLLALLSGAGDLPDAGAIGAGSGWLLGIAWLGWVPAQLLLFWGVKRISPVRTGILLMTELISGALTAAWLSGDALTWHQVMGGAMILAAGIGDVVTTRDKARPALAALPVASD